ALAAGDSACIAINGANEVAVELFLNSKIKFMDIPRLITSVLEKHEAINNPTLEEIIEIDQWARNVANELYKKRWSNC
ncbi:MAG: 1-deoxy-D-xylulose 5-phosphate reductoisomerase, partial [Clostridia bacterium]|nr:1-deoxy-D-xylulose 5-phosphate reductoisomerase [Clostridia bacterium]